MAYTDWGEFLKNYCKQMHINHMPAAVVNRLLEDHKKGLLNEVQESWIADFFEDVDGKLVRKKLPVIDSDCITDAELTKIYQAFAVALSGMKSASPFYDKVKDVDALNFVKEYFDIKQVFTIPNATPETETSIGRIVEFLQNGSSAAAKFKNDLLNIKKIDSNGQLTNDPLFPQPSDVEKLLTKCKNGEYNKNTTVQNKIQRIAQYLNGELSQFSYGSDPNKEALLQIRGDLEVVSNADAFSQIDFPTDEHGTPLMDLETFGREHLPNLLQTLYENKDIRAKFADKDEKDILGKGINKAEKLAWNDANNADYVKPKYDDVRTPLQQLEKWAGDTYNDTLKKYEELRGAHLFSSPHAKEICKAIDKVKIKPADGLNKLLDESAKVKGKIDNKNTASHFDWFVETMNEVKGDISNAIEGCWNNAEQMHCVIEKIILKATDPRTATEDDLEKAKTAMEIMTVMKYGAMTSKVMDAMRKEEFSMFSDGKLSWNKNEGIQFVTKAFDKSVKAAFLGVGYGITIARNKIMMRGMKFSDKHNASGLLANRLQELDGRQRQNDADKAALMNADARDEADRRTQEATIAALEPTYAADKAHKETVEEELNRLNEQIQNKQQEITELEEEIATAEQEQQLAEQEFQNQSQFKESFDQAEDIIANRDLDKEKDELDIRDADTKNRLDEIDDILSHDPLLDPDGNPITDPDTVKAYKERLANNRADLFTQRTDIKKSLKQNADDRNPATMSAARRDKLTSANDARNDFITNHQADYDNAQTNLDDKNRVLSDKKDKLQTAKDNLDRLNNDYNVRHNDPAYRDASTKVGQYDEATKKLNELTKTHEQREKALSTWDQDHVNKVLYLENYWNMLNGDESKTWRLFTKNQQDKFDDSKDERMRRLFLASQNGDLIP